MVPVPNSTAVVWASEAAQPEPERSPCMVGIFPIVYYSVLLGLGLPVNILTAVALSRLATRTKKSSYWYLLALTTSDILTQVFIIFVGFILQTAILARAVPSAFIHTVNVLEFTANHASIWVTVLLTMDRYVALCHPLRYRTVSYPQRTRKIIAAVFGVALATGIPFYWWLDVWRDADPPTALDTVLKWVHCVTIYFLPCSIFLATNSIIICKLKRRRRSGGGQPRLSKTTALLLAVTTVFIVLWAPRTIVMICHLYVASVKRDWRMHLALDIANMVAMLNTTLNFFLYCFVSQTFRRTVGEVLRAHLRHGPRPGSGRFLPPALKPLELLAGTAL
ncbi:PREDICTED: probable G-protein coupled receptor 142 [Haliaeetus leucocephalus]|uniref:probable G-protein coupled receptor 142 n=1 Tax=Haliaeetus leucocephalus TaxID=52644 RepID=UPI00053CE609|nr:PREDICTED: probable G-protein coupled receptor 142 [Haliaeetus leucocephalus]